MFLFESEKETFSLKPMNCPSHMLIYQNTLRSYRDLPIRIHDQGILHRNELSGALGGLTRTRQFCQDDAHIFCTLEQVQKEIETLFGLVKKAYDAFGLSFAMKFSTKPKDAIGDWDTWTRAELALEGALRTTGQVYTIGEGQGAFYGPKIDFEVTDSLGRHWQTATIQLDFVLPERFKLEYIAEDGKAHQPVVIHRAIFGSFERFIAILLEHFQGSLPTWLSPVQARVLPISDEVLEYATERADDLAGFGVSVDVDSSSNPLGAKIRNAEMNKVPWIVVVGKKEQENRTLALRQRGKGDLGAKSLDEAGKLIAADAQAPF
jgi:threonyl-tRNA synthetase